MPGRDVGDVATTFVLLFGGGCDEWGKWDELKTPDKVLGVQDLFRGVYELAHREVDDKTL